MWRATAKGGELLVPARAVLVTPWAAWLYYRCGWDCLSQSVLPIMLFLLSYGKNNLVLRRNQLSHLRQKI